MPNQVGRFIDKSKGGDSRCEFHAAATWRQKDEASIHELRDAPSRPDRRLLRGLKGQTITTAGRMSVSELEWPK
jgi:hypothetical protein